MPPKGQTNNANGRPPGTPNKSTAQLRQFITAFIEHNAENLQSEFDKMDGPEKFRVIEKLLPYVLPKMETQGANDATTLPAPIIVLHSDHPKQ